MDNFNIGYCSLCNSDNTSPMQELIEDNFDGKSYQYYESYMHCNDCGFEFVTSEQSTNNLTARIKGEQVSVPALTYSSKEKMYKVGMREAFVQTKEFLFPQQDKKKYEYLNLLEVSLHKEQDEFYRFIVSLQTEEQKEERNLKIDSGQVQIFKSLSEYSMAYCAG